MAPKRLVIVRQRGDDIGDESRSGLLRDEENRCCQLCGGCWGREKAASRTAVSGGRFTIVYANSMRVKGKAKSGKGKSPLAKSPPRFSHLTPLSGQKDVGQLCCRFET